MFWAENFRMVNSEIYSWSSLFLNISRLTPNLVPVSWKVYKIQPIRVAYTKPINLKFCAPFKINIQKRERLSYLKILLIIFCYYIQERTVEEENQKCVDWILRLSNRDYGYLILKFSALDRLSNFLHIYFVQILFSNQGRKVW